MYQVEVIEHYIHKTVLVDYPSSYFDLFILLYCKQETNQDSYLTTFTFARFILALYDLTINLHPSCLSPHAHCVIIGAIRLFLLSIYFIHQSVICGL